ncbi:hypothetical protein ACOSP7_031366 [Xanthoceras sorbifolium]
MLSGCSGLGVVVRNTTGIAVFAADVPLKFCADVEIAEARAILAGIQLATERGDIGNIIFYIQSLMSSLNIVFISFIFRLENGVGHGIAKRAFDLDCIQYQLLITYVDFKSLDVFNMNF